MRIVLDTNIYIASLFSSSGASFAIIDYLIQEAKKGNTVNCISVPLALEIEEVMLRQKNRDKYSYFTDNDLERLLCDFILISNKVKLYYLWRPLLHDIKDDKVLETAFNAKADMIVTHNLKDFSQVEELFDIKVVTPKEYLTLIRK